MASLGLCLFPGWRERGIHLLGGGLTAQVQGSVLPSHPEGGAGICFPSQNHHVRVSLEADSTHLMTTVTLQCKEENAASPKKSEERRVWETGWCWGEGAGVKPGLAGMGFCSEARLTPESEAGKCLGVLTRLFLFLHRDLRTISLVQQSRHRCKVTINHETSTVSKWPGVCTFYRGEFPHCWVSWW